MTIPSLSRLLALALAAAPLAGQASPAKPDAGAAGSPQPSARRLGLNPLKVNGVEQALASMVQSKLCAELASASRWETTCPDDLEAVAQIAKEGTAFGACDSDDCARQVTELHKSERVVTGELSRIQGTLVISLVLTETESGRAVGRLVEKLPDAPDRILERMAELARKLWK